MKFLPSIVLLFAFVFPTIAIGKAQHSPNSNKLEQSIAYSHKTNSLPNLFNSSVELYQNHYDKTKGDNDKEILLARHNNGRPHSRRVKQDRLDNVLRNLKEAAPHLIPGPGRIFKLLKFAPIKMPKKSHRYYRKRRR